MTIGPATFGAAAVTEQSNARDVRSDRDRSPDEFAGVLAGVVQAPPKQVEAKKPAEEGTSELDRPDDDAKHEDSKTKRARGPSATNAAAGQTPTDPAPINQSIGALDPELQAKLASVMSRMSDETGHDVKVVETFRTQARQDALFAQGRETPGQVVTWTHNSKHTQGRAVDLVLDNGAADLDAYQVLQRIAGEEGLRTLGPRDPGHLELPTTTGPATNGGATLSIPTEAADASGKGQVSIARLSQLAQVTQVSVEPPQVARVATVARVNTPGETARTTMFGAPQPDRSAHGTEGNTTETVQSTRGAAGDAQHASRRFGSDPGDRDGSTPGEHRGYSALAAAVALRDASSSASASPAQSVNATPGVTAAERAAKLLAALEDAPPRPLSQITMSVDAGNGTTDRVQLAMRGSSLDATIDAADPRAAQTMATRSDELVRALSRDGIELESLRVRAAAGATTIQAATAASSPSDTNTNSRFERGNAWQHQQDRQRSHDDRRQQRDQRGGQKQ